MEPRLLSTSNLTLRGYGRTESWDGLGCRPIQPLAQRRPRNAAADVGILFTADLPTDWPALGELDTLRSRTTAGSPHPHTPQRSPIHFTHSHSGCHTGCRGLPAAALGWYARPSPRNERASSRRFRRGVRWPRRTTHLLGTTKEQPRQFGRKGPFSMPRRQSFPEFLRQSTHTFRAAESPRRSLAAVTMIYPTASQSQKLFLKNVAPRDEGPP